MTPGFGWKAFTCVCLLVAAVLRFCCFGDVEYKDDEDQLFRYSQAVPATGLWPAIGTTSGAREIRHPALGIWSFAVLAQLFHLRTPVAVTGSVAGLSVIALALLFWFAWRVVPDAEREVWLWTAALASVSLVAVVYARKIWIPSLLSIFCVLLLIAWSYRHRPVGALVWGLIGAVIGQIHMSGFFYAAAVLAVTALLARGSVRWRAWFVGSVWGTVPLLPWLTYMWINDPAPPVAGSLPAPLAIFDFFRMAFEISLSQTAEFNIGSHFQEYLAYPVLFGLPTHGVSAARSVMQVLGTIVVVGGAVGTLKQLRASKRGWIVSDTHACLLGAALTLVALALARVVNAPNHHLMVFPIEYLWLPVAVTIGLPKPRVWLAVVWVGSAVCSFAFLQFIHEHCGAPNADYGIAYRCQDGATTRSPDLEALIRAGQEEVVARMLGRGEMLPGACSLAEGQIDRTFVRATYACGDDRIGVRLVHVSQTPDGAPRTRSFGVLAEGSPPAGLVDALVERVRSEERGFTWLLEAGRQTSRDVADAGSYGYYLPVLTSRQVLLGMVGGAVIVLLSWPWWAARVTEPDAASPRRAPREHLIRGPRSTP